MFSLCFCPVGIQNSVIQFDEFLIKIGGQLSFAGPALPPAPTYTFGIENGNLMIVGEGGVMMPADVDPTGKITYTKPEGSGDKKVAKG